MTKKEFFDKKLSCDCDISPLKKASLPLNSIISPLKKALSSLNDVFYPITLLKCPFFYTSAYGKSIFAAPIVYEIKCLMMINKKIVAFGDSIMKGVVAAADTQNPRYVTSDEGFLKRCERIFGMKIYNYACFGSTTLNGLKYLDRHLKDIQDADYAFLEFGGNDCDYNWKEISEKPDEQHYPKTGMMDFISHYTELINRVIHLKVKPVILSLPLIDAERYFNFFSVTLNRNNILQWLHGKVSNIYHWHEMYNVELFKIASRFNIPIIDITTPFLREKNYQDYLCSDGIHPNEKGHALIASAICEYSRNL